VKYLLDVRKRRLEMDRWVPVQFLDVSELFLTRLRVSGANSLVVCECKLTPHQVSYLETGCDKLSFSYNGKLLVVSPSSITRFRMPILLEGEVKDGFRVVEVHARVYRGKLQYRYVGRRNGRYLVEMEGSL